MKRLALVAATLGIGLAGCSTANTCDSGYYYHSHTVHVVHTGHVVHDHYIYHARSRR